MTSIDTLDDAQLAKAVKSRKKYLEKVIKFILDLTLAEGKQTYYNQGSSNTHALPPFTRFPDMSVCTLVPRLNWCKPLCCCLPFPVPC